MTASIALLSDSETLKNWEAEAISAALNDTSADVSLDLVIINDTQDETRLPAKLASLVTEFSLWRWLVAVRMFEQMTVGPPDYAVPTPLGEVHTGSPPDLMHCSPQPVNPYGNRLPKDAVDRLGDVDLALRFGFGILQGDALNAPTHGVLSFHHGDLREYRGRPAGFYEFLNHEPQAGVTVQRLTSELDSGEIAAETQCNISDATSWRDVKRRLFTASPPVLTEAVDRCLADDPLAQPSQLGDMYTLPNNRQFLKYLTERLLRTTGLR